LQKTFHTITFYGNSELMLFILKIYSLFPHDYVLRKLSRFLTEEEKAVPFHTITFYGNFSALLSNSPSPFAFHTITFYGNLSLFSSD